MADDEAFTIRTLKEFRSIMSTQMATNNPMDRKFPNKIAAFSQLKR